MRHEWQQVLLQDQGLGAGGSRQGMEAGKRETTPLHPVPARGTGPSVKGTPKGLYRMLGDPKTPATEGPGRRAAAGGGHEEGADGCGRGLDRGQAQRYRRLGQELPMGRALLPLGSAGPSVGQQHRPAAAPHPRRRCGRSLNRGACAVGLRPSGRARRRGALTPAEGGAATAARSPPAPTQRRGQL